MLSQASRHPYKQEGRFRFSCVWAFCVGWGREGELAFSVCYRKAESAYMLCPSGLSFHSAHFSAESSSYFNSPFACSCSSSSPAGSTARSSLHSINTSVLCPHHKIDPAVTLKLQWVRKMLASLPVAGKTQGFLTNGKGLSYGPCPRGAAAKKFAIPCCSIVSPSMVPEPSQGTEGGGSEDGQGKSQQRRLRCRCQGMDLS